MRLGHTEWARHMSILYWIEWPAIYTNVDSLAILLPDNESGTLSNIMRKIEALMNDAISASTDLEALLILVVQTDKASLYPVSFFMKTRLQRLVKISFELFDGKHQTPTTKSRLNAILSKHGMAGECVFQKKGQWFVNYDGAVIPFFSGMRLA
jgi:hypothetical protein